MAAPSLYLSPGGGETVGDYVGALAWYNLASFRMRENAWIEQSYVS
jgi:hypothetical protein